MRKLIIAVIIAILLSPSQAYSKSATHVNKKYGFSIKYPESYHVLKNYKKVPLIIFFPSKNLFNFFKNNVAVNVIAATASERPLEEIVEIYFKYDKTVLSKEEISIDGIKFLSVTQAQKKSLWFLKLDIKLHHLITVNGNRIYTITYSANANNYDKHAEEAESIMESIRFL